MRAANKAARISFGAFVALFGLICLSVTAGCSKHMDDQQADKELRKGFADKGKQFKDLPPAQQAMVRAMMGGDPTSKPGAAEASASATPKK